MVRNNVSFSNIDIEKCKFVDMLGDNYGKVNLIIDIQNDRIYFSYSGEIVCELNENLRAIWNNNVSNRVKNLIRENIKVLKKQNV